MKKLTLLGLSLLLSFGSFCQTPEWDKVIAARGGNATRSYVAEGNNGNVVVTGNFSGLMILAGDSVESNGGTFIASFDESTSLNWLISSTVSSGGNFPGAVTTDIQGNIYVTGSFHDTLRFGDKAIYAIDYFDVYVAKFSSSGQCLWLKGFYLNPGNWFDESGIGLKLDQNNNIYVLAYHSGNAYVIKLDNNGTAKWERHILNISDVDLQVSDLGNAYIVGYTYTTIQIDNKPYLVDSTGIILIDLNINGSISEVVLLNNLGMSVGGVYLAGAVEDFYRDANGNFYILGKVAYTTLHFNCGIVSSQNYKDHYLLKVDQNKNCRWVKKISATQVSDFTLAGKDGVLYVLGSFIGNITLESTPFFGLNQTAFVASYNFDGEFQWAQKVYTSQYRSQLHRLIVEEGYMWAVGDGYGLVDFDSISENLDGFFLSRLSGIPNPSSTPTTAPSLILNTGQINAGQSINITGKNFSQSAAVHLSIDQGNLVLADTFIMSGPAGGFTFSFVTSSSLPQGMYRVSATDTTRGLTTPNNWFWVYPASSQPINYLNIIAPQSGEEFAKGEPVNISWQDVSQKNSAYPREGIKRKFKYEIAYSDDNGGSWNPLTTKEGADYLDREITLSESLQIPGEGSFKIRITDTYFQVNEVVSPAFTIKPATSSNVKVDLVWDFSYPKPLTSLKGVAADGTSRIYMKVAKINQSGSSISKVDVVLADNFSNNSPALLGKVMPATAINKYDLEANAAKQINATQNQGQNNEFWFWYVAPDDFAGNDPKDADGAMRTVKANFTIHYQDNTQDQFTKEIKVVRPPLVFVHGLGGDASTWDNFKYVDKNGIQRYFVRPGLEDSRFLVVKALQFYSAQASNSFDHNALELIYGVEDNTLNLKNSLPGVINNLRDQGYAANKVDYVCHSMGGTMLRRAEDLYYNQFYQKNGSQVYKFNNYEKGWVNKLITISTPHQGSPLADIVMRYLPRHDIGGFFKKKYQGSEGPFIRSIYYPDGSELKLTQEVEGLQVSVLNGGFSYPDFNVKTHLISSDLLPKVQFNSTELVDRSVLDILSGYEDYFLIDVLDMCFQISQITELNLYRRIQLGNIAKEANNSSANKKLYRALAFLNYAATVLYPSNFATFLPESDGVVSVQSQLNGQLRGAPTTSVISPAFHAFIPKLHVLEKKATGEEVSNLLNTAINNASFAILNAARNKRQERSDWDSEGPNLISEITMRNDTSKLKFILLNVNLTKKVDSLLYVRIAVKEKSNLEILQLFFQDQMLDLPIDKDTVEYYLPVTASFIDSQELRIQALYVTDDTAYYLFDKIELFVTTSSPLLSFMATPSTLYMRKGDRRSPSYTGVYANFSTGEGIFSNRITATIDNPSIASFDATTKEFIGLDTGETFAVASFEGKKDTVYLVIGAEIEDITSVPEIPAIPRSNEPLENISAFPNPFSDAISVTFNLRQPLKLSYRVFDITGKQVSATTVHSHHLGENRIELDFPDLSAGFYTLKISSDQFSKTLKLLKLE